MIKFLKKILISHRYLTNFFYRRVMANETVKNKSDSNLEHLPVKKLKLADEVLPKRTVGTMCGAWRGEEEYGGLVFVFKTREPWASPDPTKECDYPENVQDFWDASLVGSDEIQVPSFKSPIYCIVLKICSRFRKL